MAYAEYDLTTLPVIEKSYSNEQEVTKKYLGGRAVTGQEYATLNIFIVDNAEAEALYKFWRDDCDYGTSPFLVGLPFNGVEYFRDVPNVLCKFTEDILAEKVDVHWNQTVKLKVLEYSENSYNIVDDAGNIMVDDAGNTLVSTSTPITNSNKEITYG